MRLRGKHGGQFSPHMEAILFSMFTLDTVPHASPPCLPLCHAGQLQIRKIYSMSNASIQNHTDISWPGTSLLLSNRLLTVTHVSGAVLALWASLLICSFYSDGNPPKDSPVPDPIPYPLWSVLIVTITTGIGMICAIICLVVTLAYRKHR